MLRREGGGVYSTRAHHLGVAWGGGWRRRDGKERITDVRKHAPGGACLVWGLLHWRGRSTGITWGGGASRGVRCSRPLRCVLLAEPVAEFMVFFFHVCTPSRPLIAIICPWRALCWTRGGQCPGRRTARLGINGHVQCAPPAFANAPTPLYAWQWHRHAHLDEGPACSPCCPSVSATGERTESHQAQRPR